MYAKLSIPQQFKDPWAADNQLILDNVKEKFEQVIHQGINLEILIYELCDKLQILFEKISMEDFSAFLRILNLSKMIKAPNSIRGKTKPYYASKKKKAKIIYSTSVKLPANIHTR